MAGFLNSIFHLKNEKSYAEKALVHSLHENEYFQSFIPFLAVWNMRRENKIYRCEAPSLIDAVNMGYELLAAQKHAHNGGVRAYVLAYLDTYRLERKNRVYINFESGLAGKEKALKFIQAYMIGKDGRVQTKSLPLEFANDVHNGLLWDKTVAWIVVNETGDFAKALAPFPTTLILLMCSYENIKITKHIYDFLVAELQVAINSFPDNKAVLMAAGHCLKALTEGRSSAYSPEGGSSIELFRSTIHHGCQVLIEASRSKLIPLDDLKVCFRNFYELLLKALLSNSIQNPTQDLKLLISYLKSLSEEPLEKDAGAFLGLI